MRRSNGTFLAGAGGRTKGGARNRLTVRVFEDVLTHWNEPDASGGKTKGMAALEIMLKERPSEYVRAVLSILPKELQIESVMSDLNDEQLDELLVKIRDALVAGKAGEVEEEGADGRLN